VSTPRRLLPLVLVAGALAAAGCGGGDGGGGGAPVATNAIGMQDLKFDPASARVTVGQKVTWTNDESIPHDVKATSGADFKSETFGKGGTFSFTPTKAGKIEYVCTLHPGMDGTLDVVAK
jgi:plastocyanin